MTFPPWHERTADPTARRGTSESPRYFRLVIAQAPPGAGAVRQPRSSFIERPSAQREYLGESGDAASAAALCMDVLHDRAPRRPDEQFANVVLGTAVAARARRLNRLLAQAALVPHSTPAADDTMCVLYGASTRPTS